MSIDQIVRLSAVVFLAIHWWSSCLRCSWESAVDWHTRSIYPPSSAQCHNCFSVTPVFSWSATGSVPSHKVWKRSFSREWCESAPCDSIVRGHWWSCWLLIGRVGVDQRRVRGIHQCRNRFFLTVPFRSPTNTPPLGWRSSSRVTWWFTTSWDCFLACQWYICR